MHSKKSYFWFLCTNFYISVICLNSIVFTYDVPEVKNLTEFLEKSLERKVLNYTISPLKTVNYHVGALIHKVAVEVAKNSESDENDAFNFVIKTWRTDPYLNAARSFLVEERFYSSIIPAIETFEQISNVSETERIDAFIKCFGSRLSLKPNAIETDSDVLFLFETIDHKKFVNIDTRIGFDFEETLAIIKFVGKFNALCIAMQRLQPTLFNTKIRNYLGRSVHLWRRSARNIVTIGNGLSYIENLDTELRIIVENQLRLNVTQKEIVNCINSIDTNDRPYKTIYLEDLRANNIMIKKSENEPIKLKVYDFNLYSYQSFAANLIVFLFTSVRLDVLTTNFTFLIDAHHSEFIKTMNLVNCPLDDYTYEKLWKEVRDKAKNDLLFILINRKKDIMFPFSFPNLNILSQTIPSKEVLDAWKNIIETFKNNGLI